LFTTISVYAQPANNDCNNAITLGNTQNWCSTVGQYTTINATDANGFSPATCMAQGVTDVWFSFVATGSDVDITVNGDAIFGPDGGTMSNPEVVLYSGNCSGTINQEQCASDIPGLGSVSIYKGGLIIGQPYLIRVDTRNSTGTFQLCINNYSPPALPQGDCPTATVICDKSPLTVNNVSGGGSNNSEMDDGGCFNGGVNIESNSAWYAWTAGNNGTLTFDLVPLVNNDDLDFILYELPNGVGNCNGKVAIRCMASGSLNFPSPCMGPTGLNTTANDLSEAPDCQPGDDNYLAQLVMVAGRSYALAVNNFTSGNGFTISFGGTGEFLNPTPDFTVSPTNGCNGDLINVVDNSTYPIGSITGWVWNFGTGATPATSGGQGPHSTTYSTPGTKTITLTVISDLGCEVTTTKTVSIIDCCALNTSTSATDPTCGNSNGSIVVTIANGTPPYTWTWNPNVSTTNTGLNLNAGTYQIEVEDATGCQTTLSQVLTSSGSTIALTVSEVSGVECIGDANGSAMVTVNGGTPSFTYLWDNGETTSTAINLNAGTHVITVTDSDGCTETGSVNISSPTQIAITLLSTSGGCDALCNKSADVSVSGGSPPYAYLWSNNETTPNATALCPGVNTVSIIDNNGCIEALDVMFNSSSFSAMIIQDSILRCNSDCDAQLSVSTSGGNVPFQYQWSTGSVGSIIDDLCIGSYRVTVTDAGGCIIVDSVIVTEPQKIFIVADVTDVSCGNSNGEITMNASGGVPGYGYQWNNNANTPNISGLSIGTYTVTVTDENACCSIVSLIVDMDDCCTNTSNPCVDAIQGTINICTEINADPTIPLSTIDCDGDGVTNADECVDGTDPLDPCDYEDTSITLPVTADQTDCPVPCPDLTPIMTILPGNIAGQSAVEVAVQVTELDSVDTNGSIVTVRIPSDPRLVFVWNIGLTMAALVPVQNASWNYLGNNGFTHTWTYNGPGLIIPAESVTAFGFQAFYDPQSTDGQTTLTVTIIPFSGGECNPLNNTDSERLVYFE